MHSVLHNFRVVAPVIVVNTFIPGLAAEGGRGFAARLGRASLQQVPRLNSLSFTIHCSMNQQPTVQVGTIAMDVEGRIIVVH